MSSWHFGVLGPLEVTYAESTVEVGGPSARRLLAALLCFPGEPVRTDSLVDAVWGADPPASAVRTMQKLLSRLRSTLSGVAIERASGGYRLVIDPQDVDWKRLERAASESDESVWSGALTSWRGDPLPELVEWDPARHLTVRLLELRVRLQELRLQRALYSDPTAAVPELEALVAADPLREQGWVLFVDALRLAGRQADALAAYSRARTVLAAELGIEPSSQLQAAEGRVLNGPPPVQSLATAPSTVLHETVPNPPTRLIGRSQELDSIVTELPDRPLVSVVGIGGIGKTRLCIEVARLAAPSFPGGTWFVELAEVGSEDSVAQAVADALGVIQHPGRSIEDSIAAFLASRDALVVLDNCEHVLESVAALVDRLLGAAPGLRILTTSREALAVPGERVIPLGPLQTTDDAPGAVILFSERAADVGASLDLDDAEESALIKQVCRQLDGIPLALELAAARLRSLTLADLNAGLTDMLRVLRGGRSRIERHRTLQATIEWGYGHLTTPAQRLFETASVFVGGFTLDAIEALGGDVVSDVYDALDELVSRSFVMLDRTSLGGRYRILEPIRQFGEVHLTTDPDRAREMRDHHLRYYTRFAESIGHGIDTTSEPQIVPRLWPDYANVRAAQAHAVDRQLLDQAARIPVSLDLVRYQYMLYEIADWAEATLNLDDVANHDLYYELINSVALTATDRGQLDKLAAYADLAVNSLGRDHPSSAFASTQGLRLVLDGDYDAGIAILEHSQPRDQARARWRDMTLVQLAHVADAPHARDIANAILAEDPEVLPPSLAAIVYAQRATCHALLDEPEQALHDALASNAISARLPGNALRNYPSLGETAAYAVNGPAPDDALGRTQAALVAWRDAGNRFQVWMHLAWVACLLDNHQQTSHAAELAQHVLSFPTLTRGPSFAPLVKKLTQIAQDPPQPSPAAAAIHIALDGIYQIRSRPPTGR